MGKVKSFPKDVQLVSHRGRFKVRSLTSEPMLLTSKVCRALNLCQMQESLQPSKVQKSLSPGSWPNMGQMAQVGQQEQ